MATLFDYLNDKGTFSLQEVEFNQVDALILSIISYLPFDNIVSTNPLKKITIKNTAKLLKVETPISMEQRLFNSLATSKRYQNMELSAFINEIDFRTDKQFAAILIDTKDHLLFISYRGTDSTIIGWKEDLKMSFMLSIPSQLRAVTYLERIGATFTAPIRLGGHSKGGNLAVYAASFCAAPLQKRIACVYNNDGPGLSNMMSTKEGYLNIKRKIKTFVPQTSIVGMLFEHHDELTIVHSTELGLMQHNPFSWEINNGDFIYLNELTSNSIFVDKTLKKWISELEPWQKEKVIETLFELFKNSNIYTLSDLKQNWYPNVVYLAKSLARLDNPSKRLLLQTLKMLIKAAKNNINKD